MYIRTRFEFRSGRLSRSVRPARRGPPPADRATIEALEVRSMLAATMAPSFAISDATILEGNEGIRYAAVDVKLSAVASKSVQISYKTSDGNASAGSDYTTASGTLTFASGEISKTILLGIKGDRVGEVN